MPLFKVWSLTQKKCVIATTLNGLISSGRQKLGIKEEKILVYLEDGTEVDDDDVFQELSPGTILYLLNEDDEKPWEWKNVSVLAENLTAPLDVIESSSEAETTSTESPLDAIQGQLLLPWPKRFRIAESQFSSELRIELTSPKLSWRAKSELLGHLSREISKYTYKPTVVQRDDVARELVTLFPTLKSNIGEGHHGWSQKIYDKMCEENKRRKNSAGKRPASKGGVKNVKVPRRGEINFTPSLDLNVELNQTCKDILAEEALKPLESRNFKLIQDNMIITFSHRRELVSQKILAAELKVEYPILFSEFGVLTDFKLLNGFDLEPRFLLRLNNCSERIKEEAILLKSKKQFVKRSPYSLKDILDDNLPSKEEAILLKSKKQFAKRSSYSLKDILDDNLPSDITALRLLPILLLDHDQSYLYRIYPHETDPEIIKTSGPETPHVAILNNISDTSLCFIVVEKDIIFSVHGFVKSLMLMFSVYYCCNMKYATEVDRTLKFFQIYLLEMPEATKLPSKLITFCGKMP